METEIWTPPKAANKLVRIAEMFSNAHGLERFPVNVEQLALGAGQIFGWSDHIVEVKSASFGKFEGGLFRAESKDKWLLLYNSELNSQGRIRFTQAHELGHYILHRMQKDNFQCSDTDMLNWTKDEKDIEGQADLFASYLLMPLNDFRNQLPAVIDLDALGQCAERYGVSLTASILKWLDYTDEVAILISSRDGYMNWASASGPAMKAGAFFRTRNNIIEIPAGSLARNDLIKNEKAGQPVSSSVWFPNSEEQFTIREMKIQAEQYDSVITLLHLPKHSTVYPKRELQ